MPSSNPLTLSPILPHALRPQLNASAAEILSLRHGMWTAIASRSHSPTKIFPFGPNSTEVMIYGTVEFVFKEGGQASKDWAARAELVKADGGWKLGFYQVYLDTK